MLLRKVAQKNDRLEKLCRALQAERRELSKELEGNKPLNEVSNGQTFTFITVEK